jgi:hypothetical protein
LLTYSNGDSRWRASDSKAAQANLGNGAGILWWSFDPRDGFDSGGDGLWSSSKKKLGAGHSGEVG